jgi:hypothetical protein
MWKEEWTMLDGGSRLYKEEHTFIHEARIRRDLILLSIEYDEVYIHGSNHEKQYVFSLNLEEVFFKEKP